MVLTAAQTRTFFENDQQISLSRRTKDDLISEGISSVEDLGEWDDNDWDAFAASCRKPEQIEDPANARNLINQAPFALPVKSLKRLKIASKLIRHYEAILMEPVADNVKWNCLKSYDQQHKALLDKKKNSTLNSVPKLNKSTTVPRWMDSIRLHLRLVYGGRDSNLLYLIREDDAVPAPAPTTAAGLPHTADGGSVEGDLEMRLSHVHPLFDDDNAKLYQIIEEAIRGSAFEASIKPFETTQNGHAAFKALTSQHAGKAKYRVMLKQAKDYVQNMKWDGTTNYTLASHVNKCRDSYVNWGVAAQYIPDQVPNDQIKVYNFLESIKDCVNPDIAAARSAIRIEKNGFYNDWEKAVEHILPCCPVSAKKNKKKGGTNPAEVSTAETVKKGVGKTGVELRWHKRSEFKDLTKEQKDELVKYHRDNNITNPNGKGGGNPRNNGKSNWKHNKGGPFKKWSQKKFNKQVKKQVKSSVAALMKEKEKEDGEVNDLVQKIESELSSKRDVSSAVKLATILKKRKREDP